MPAMRPRNSIRITAETPMSAPPISDSMGVNSVAANIPTPLRSVNRDPQPRRACGAAQDADPHGIPCGPQVAGRRGSLLQRSRLLAEAILEADRRLPLMHAEVDGASVGIGPGKVCFRNVGPRHLEREILAPHVLETASDMMLHRRWRENVEQNVA